MSGQISGRCPACGSSGTLFVGAGGWITCGLDRCLNPTAVSDLLDPKYGASTPHDLDSNITSWHAGLMKQRRTIVRRKGSSS